MRMLRWLLVSRRMSKALRKLASAGVPRSFARGSGSSGEAPLEATAASTRIIGLSVNVADKMADYRAGKTCPVQVLQSCRGPGYFRRGLSVQRMMPAAESIRGYSWQDVS